MHPTLTLVLVVISCATANGQSGRCSIPIPVTDPGMVDIGQYFLTNNKGEVKSGGFGYVKCDGAGGYIWDDGSTSIKVAFCAKFNGESNWWLPYHQCEPACFHATAPNDPNVVAKSFTSWAIDDSISLAQVGSDVILTYRNGYVWANSGAQQKYVQCQAGGQWEPMYGDVCEPLAPPLAQCSSPLIHLGGNFLPEPFQPSVGPWTEGETFSLVVSAFCSVGLDVFDVSYTYMVTYTPEQTATFTCNSDGLWEDAFGVVVESAFCCCNF